MASFMALSAASSVCAVPAALKGAQHTRITRTPVRLTQRRSVAVVAKAQGKEAAAAAAVSAATLTQAAPALAGVNEFAADLQSKIDAANALAGQVGGALNEGKKVAGEAAKTAKPLVDAATPYVKQAVTEATKAATPVLKEGLKEVEKAGSSATTALKASGVDVDTVAKVTKQGAGIAEQTLNPVAKSAVQFVTTSSPETILTYGAVLGGVILTSGIWGPLVSKSFRGYAGDMTAVFALDRISQGNALVVDIRDANEVLSKGTIDPPRGAGGNFVKIPLQMVEDLALRSQMAGAGDLEAKCTAYCIAACNKANKSTTIMLLGRNGGDAKEVARCLVDLGFKQTYVIMGGFEGRNGWKQSNLACVDGSGAAMTSGSGRVLGSVIPRVLSVPGSEKKLPKPSGSARGSRRETPPAPKPEPKAKPLPTVIPTVVAPKKAAAPKPAPKAAPKPASKPAPKKEATKSTGFLLPGQSGRQTTGGTGKK